MSGGRDQRRDGTQRALAEGEQLRMRGRLAEIETERSELQAKLDAAQRTPTTGELGREQLEAVARRLVERGPEGRKVEFKRSLDLTTSSGKSDFAKDVSSIANSDDEQHHDDWGIMVVGAARGEIVGGVAEFADGKLDAHQAHMAHVLSRFISPVPQVSPVGFVDPAKGPWGVILIPPSIAQPHVFIRDASDIVKHEWWVRVNDTNERASPLDYERVRSKAISRAVRPLEREIQRLSLQVEGLEHASGVAAWLRKIPHGARLKLFWASRGGGGFGSTGFFDRVDPAQNSVYIQQDAVGGQPITNRAHAIEQVRFVHTDGNVWFLTIDN